jgi:hypothetical protein
MTLGGVHPSTSDDSTIALAQRALGEVLATPLSCLSRAELGEHLLELQTLRNQLDAALCDAALAADEQAVNLLKPGVRTTAQFAAANRPVDPALIRADSRLAHWLRDFPVLAEAFARGRISRAHLTNLRLAHRNRFHELMVRDQHLFVEHAATLDFKGCGRALAYWLLHADPDGELAKEQLQKTGVTIRENPDGSVRISGWLDPLSAAAFKAAHGHEAQKVFDADQERGWHRTLRQQNAEALLNLLARGFARQDGSFPAPLFDIVMSQKVAEDTLARLAEPSNEPLPLDHEDVDGRCELIDGTPIHPWLASQVMHLGRFRRHIFKPDGIKLDSTTAKSHRFPKWMGHLLRIEGRGRCLTPGCDSPFHWLHNDHVHPRSRGGATATGNGGNRCRPDNLWKSDDPGRAG